MPTPNTVLAWDRPASPGIRTPSMDGAEASEGLWMVVQLITSMHGLRACVQRDRSMPSLQYKMAESSVGKLSTWTSLSQES
eukprot:scaffold48_cov395-Prasinococcus_capsulatus_cf.AAC.21